MYPEPPEVVTFVGSDRYLPRKESPMAEKKSRARFTGPWLQDHELRELVQLVNKLEEDYGYVRSDLSLLVGYNSRSSLSKAYRNITEGSRGGNKLVLVALRDILKEEQDAQKELEAKKKEKELKSATFFSVPKGTDLSKVENRPGSIIVQGSNPGWQSHYEGALQDLRAAFAGFEKAVAEVPARYRGPAMQALSNNFRWSLERYERDEAGVDDPDNFSLADPESDF